MIKVDILKNHPNTIPALAHIWHEVLGKIWVPDVSVERVIARFADHLSDKSLPITFVALDGDVPVGMCSLRENDGIRPDLTPWLGSCAFRRCGSLIPNDVDQQFRRIGITDSERCGSLGAKRRVF